MIGGWKEKEKEWDYIKMKTSKIIEITNKVYPLISEKYNCDAKIEYHKNIYERLSGVKGMTGEVCAHAEYDWLLCKIYIYTSRILSEEDIIRSLIHECVHSTQNKWLFDRYYDEGETYDTHPYEIEARNAEEEWKKYKKV